MRVLALLAVLAPLTASADVQVHPLLERQGTDLGASVIATGFCDTTSRALVLLRTGAIVELDERGAMAPVANIGPLTSRSAIACDGSGRVVVALRSELAMIEAGVITRIPVQTGDARFARTLDDGTVGFVGDGVVTRWDGKTTTQWNFTGPRFLGTSALSGDGLMLAMVDSGAAVVVDDQGNRSQGPKGYGIAWSPSHKGLLVLGFKGLTRWNVGDPPDKLAVVDPAMRGIQLAPAGTRVMAKSFKSTTIFTVGGNGQATGQITTTRWPAGVTRVAAGDAPFAIATDNDHAHVVDLTKAGPVIDLEHPIGPIQKLAFSPDGNQLAFRGGDDDILIADSAGMIVERLTRTFLFASHLRWLHDGSIVAANGSTLTHWAPDRTVSEQRGVTFVVGLDDDGNSIDTRASCPMPAKTVPGGPPRPVTALRRGVHVAVRCGDKVLLAKDGVAKPLATAEPSNLYFALAGSRKPVIVFESGRRIMLVDSKNAAREIGALSAAPAAIVASADGRFVAIATTTGEVTIIDADTGKHVLTETSKRGTITDLAWSPNGKRLAIAAGFAVDLWLLPRLK